MLRKASESLIPLHLQVICLDVADCALAPVDQQNIMSMMVIILRNLVK